MSFQVFRFEVLDEIGRHGANAVYDVRDTADSSVLHLYEWSPPPRESSTAAESLTGVMDELDGTEAFASGPRLYVAAESTEQARKALEVLRNHNLFPGVWPGVIEPPADDRIEQPDSSGPDHAIRPRSWLGFFLTSMTVLVLMIVWCIYLSNRVDDLTKERRDAETRANNYSSQISDLKAKVDSLNSDLNTQKELVAKQQVSNAETAQTIFQLAEQNAKSATTPYTLAVHNDCSKTPTITVAVRYLSLSSGWVTRGWWQVPFGETVTTNAYSKDGLFYVYASGNGMFWPRSGYPDSIEAEIVGDRFLRQGNENLDGSNKRTVSMFRAQASSEGLLTQTFSCP